MNKRFICRGKLLECKDVWVYGYYVYTHDRHRIIFEDNEGYYCEEEVIPETVGKHTGMGGIYDGDILYGSETDEYGTILSEWYGVVYWDDEYCGFYVKDDIGNDVYPLYDYMFDEVIGNIHE